MNNCTQLKFQLAQQIVHVHDAPIYWSLKLICNSGWGCPSKGHYLWEQLGSYHWHANTVGCYITDVSTTCSYKFRLQLSLVMVLSDGDVITSLNRPHQHFSSPPTLNFTIQHQNIVCMGINLQDLMRGTSLDSTNFVLYRSINLLHTCHFTCKWPGWETKHKIMILYVQLTGYHVRV